MKATEKLTKGGLLTCLSVFTATALQAQSASKFLNGVSKDFSKDGITGIYIIGGIAIFGVLIFLISHIVRKFSKEEKKESNTIRHISHRHHHHHKVIKKSA